MPDAKMPANISRTKLHWSQGRAVQLLAMEADCPKNAKELRKSLQPGHPRQQKPDGDVWFYTRKLYGILPHRSA